MNEKPRIRAKEHNGYGGWGRVVGWGVLRFKSRVYVFLKLSCSREKELCQCGRCVSRLFVFISLSNLELIEFSKFSQEKSASRSRANLRFGYSLDLA